MINTKFKNIKLKLIGLMSVLNTNSMDQKQSNVNNVIKELQDKRDQLGEIIQDQIKNAGTNLQEGRKNYEDKKQPLNLNELLEENKTLNMVLDGYKRGREVMIEHRDILVAERRELSEVNNKLQETNKHLQERNKFLMKLLKEKEELLSQVRQEHQQIKQDLQTFLNERF